MWPWLGLGGEGGNKNNTIQCWFYFLDLIKILIEAGEVPQWVRVPDAKPRDLSSISRSHVMEGENQVP